MPRLALLIASALLAGCAATPSNTAVLGSDYLASSSAGYTDMLEASPVAASFAVGHGLHRRLRRRARRARRIRVGATPAPTSPYALEDDKSLRKNRFTIKAGYFAAEDASELGDGWMISGSWMRFFTKLLALEFELGYFDADGSSSGVKGELWGIPIMVNGRVNLPVWVLDLYGGLGLGTIYYDIEIGNSDSDGFILAGNAFLGGSSISVTRSPSAWRRSTT